jgi:hypothetical protein
MNQVDLLPSPFTLPERVVPRTPDKLNTILRFVKNKKNQPVLVDLLQINPELSQKASTLFELRDIINRQKALLEVLAKETLEHQLYEAITDSQTKQLEEGYFLPTHPYRSSPQGMNAALGSSTSGGRKGKKPV